MTMNLLSVISYILISSFTPGPSNISSASMAVLHGYKDTLKYQAGLAAGVFPLMLLSGLLSTTLIHIFPSLEPIMRYVGAAYIVYLALGILKASYTFNNNESKALGFSQGFLLQILNPKLIIYSFTLFSAFLTSVSGNIILVILASILLAAVSFCATSTWAIGGTAIKTYLHHPTLKITVNIILSILLIFTALSLIGIL